MPSSNPWQSCRSILCRSFILSFAGLCASPKHSFLLPLRWFPIFSIGRPLACKSQLVLMLPAAFVFLTALLNLPPPPQRGVAAYFEDRRYCVLEARDNSLMSILFERRSFYTLSWPGHLVCLSVKYTPLVGRGPDNFSYRHDFVSRSCLIALNFLKS